MFVPNLHTTMPPVRFHMMKHLPDGTVGVDNRAVPAPYEAINVIGLRSKFRISAVAKDPLSFQITA